MANETENFSRLDERIKILQQQQRELEERFEEALHEHSEILQKTAVLESKASRCLMETKGGQCLADDIADLDKRISAIERESGRSKDRWNQILSFVVQLAWVVLAAWVLTKLNLQPPAVP